MMRGLGRRLMTIRTIRTPLFSSRKSYTLNALHTNDLSYTESYVSSGDILATEAAPPTPEVSNQTLIQLVQDGQYDAADKLRYIMQERGAQINQHPVYEHAAIFALETPDLGTRILDFSSWISLVPDAHCSDAIDFSTTRLALFSCGTPADNIPIIMQFALICASKGYFQFIWTEWKELAPLLVRFADPGSMSRFLHQLEIEAVEYERKHFPNDTKQISRAYAGFAVRTCCSTGWAKEAVDILRKVHEDKSYPISGRTYALLLQELRKSRDRTNIQIVEELQANASSLPSLKSHLFPKSFANQKSSRQKFSRHDHNPIQSTELESRAPPASTMSSVLVPDEERVYQLNKRLVRLVLEGEYAAADHVRLQLLKSGLCIEPCKLYKRAAAASLQVRSPLDARALKFFNWVSLLPLLPSIETPNQVKAHRAHLQLQDFQPPNYTRSDILTLPLVVRASLYAVSRGYFHLGKSSLHLAIRDSSSIHVHAPSCTLQDLDAFEKNVIHASSVYSRPIPINMFRDLRIALIDAYCNVGLIEEAVETLEAGNICMPDTVYERLVVCTVDELFERVVLHREKAQA